MYYDYKNEKNEIFSSFYEEISIQYFTCQIDYGVNKNK